MLYHPRLRICVETHILWYLSHTFFSDYTDLCQFVSKKQLYLKHAINLSIDCQSRYEGLQYLQGTVSNGESILKICLWRINKQLLIVWISVDNRKVIRTPKEQVFCLKILQVTTLFSMATTHSVIIALNIE